MSVRKIGAAIVGVVMCVSSGVLYFGPVGAGAASVGDNQALAEAKTPLSTEPFSLGGLISQLKFEGYTTAQATYGAEHSGANWNKEALLNAKEYLNTEAFSMKGLTNQLEFSKYTAAQASYGVKHCGANWNTEA